MFSVVTHLYFITSRWMVRNSQRIITKIHVAIPAYIFGMILFCSYGISFPQTCIILTGDIGYIYIGADSRNRTTDPTTGNITSSRTCKIVQCGKFFFAVTGVSENKRKGFSIYETAKFVCRNETNIKAAAESIINESKIPLIDVAELARKSDKASYERFKNSIVEFVVFSVIDDMPTICVKNLQVREDNGKISITINPKYSRYTNGPFKSLVMGVDTEINKVLSRNENFLRTDPLNRIRKLIQMEIDADTAGNVGGPINVLCIYNNGFEWIDPKPPCPAKQ